MSRRSSRRRWIVLALLLLALLWWCGRPAALVLGTFNIRTFPSEKTDREAVAAALAELDADLVAVQEIRDRAAFDAVLARASARTGRRYAAALVPSCRYNRKYGRLHVGVVYDAARFTVVAVRPLGDGETCPKGQSPGVAVALRDDGGQTIAFASTHFDPGGEPERFARRMEQWVWLTDTLPGLAAELGAPVIVAGDLNTTGYLDNAQGERGFVDALVEARGLQLPTGALGCSMYWHPSKNEPHVPSLLDHVLAPKDMSFGSVEVLGMCWALACAPHDGPPPGFEAVSDHCPVRVVLHR